jgi:hypothetical protein
LGLWLTGVGSLGVVLVTLVMFLTRSRSTIFHLRPIETRRGYDQGMGLQRRVKGSDSPVIELPI